jgi:hypothetical protein
MADEEHLKSRAELNSLRLKSESKRLQPKLSPAQPRSHSCLPSSRETQAIVAGGRRRRKRGECFSAGLSEGAWSIELQSRKSIRDRRYTELDIVEVISSRS